MATEKDIFTAIASHRNASLAELESLISSEFDVIVDSDTLSELKRRFARKLKAERKKKPTTLEQVAAAGESLCHVFEARFSAQSYLPSADCLLSGGPSSTSVLDTSMSSMTTDTPGHPQLGIEADGFSRRSLFLPSENFPTPSTETTCSSSINRSQSSSMSSPAHSAST